LSWDTSSRLLAIVRYRQPGDLDGVLETLRLAGIAQLEVTLDTPGALEAVRRAREAGRPIGVGTVTSPDEVRAAADAGAAFVVGPATIPSMLGEAIKRGLDAIPGAFTPTEILLARGATAVKLFPAPVGGPAYVRALRGPMPDIPFVCTGGVTIQDARSYLEAGASCVGLGGELVGRTPPEGAEDLGRMAERAARAVAAVAAEA
jgi:2-dehydro-3-deoxyphosphogluconate aldolase/(4S)-4-hydroxy-2-oxoglutarate aldolase